MTSSLHDDLDQVSELLHPASDLDIACRVFEFVEPARGLVECGDVVPLDFLHPFLDTDWAVEEIELPRVNKDFDLREEGVDYRECIIEFVLSKSFADCGVMCAVGSVRGEVEGFLDVEAVQVADEVVWVLIG